MSRRLKNRPAVRLAREWGLAWFSASFGRLRPSGTLREDAHSIKTVLAIALIGGPVGMWYSQGIRALSGGLIGAGSGARSVRAARAAGCRPGAAVGASGGAAIGALTSPKTEPRPTGCAELSLRRHGNASHAGGVFSKARCRFARRFEER